MRQHALGLDEERALVARAVAGDPDAFARLHDGTRGLLSAILHGRYQVPHGEVDDMLQQTYLQAWAAMPRYQDRGSRFIAFLASIAHNLVADRGRALAKSPWHVGRGIRTHHGSESDDASDRAPLRIDQGAIIEQLGENETPDELPEEAFALREARRAVHGALAELERANPERAAMLRLRYLEGLDYDQASRVADKRQNNCRIIVHRGLKDMRRILEPQREAVAV